MNAQDAARATRTDVVREITASAEKPPSGRQRAYIARLALELLDVPFPESRRDADAVIRRLRSAVDGAKVTAADDSDIPF